MSIGPVWGWRSMNNWFKSQAALNQQLSAANDGANAAFATAHTNYYQGMASFAATAAVNRLHAEASAKSATLQALTKSVGATVNTVA
jgi:hypothetical protein